MVVLHSGCRVVTIFSMSHYLLSVWHADSYELDFSSDEAQRRVAQVGQFNADLQADDALVFAGGLHPKESASVARWDGTQVSLTDGAFSEAQEQMGGFWIINADSLESAQDWARRASAACECPVEIRPLQGG